jgi:hypothetical protein
MSTQNKPVAVGDYVEVQYDADNALDDGEIRGRVTDVDTDPDNRGVELSVKVDEGEPNQEILYTEGEWEGDPYTNVTRYDEFSGTYNLGDNATIRELE